MSQPGEPSPVARSNAPASVPFSASGRTTLLAGAVIALAALAAYHNSFSVPFILDDHLAITENPTIRHLWPVQTVLSPPGGALTVSGRPLVNLSLALNYALGGTAVWSYHALNLAVHILAGLTLFGIVRRTLLQPALSERFGAASLPLAFAVALLWTVHPLQTEAVTYIVQRAESLVGLFCLLTLYCFIRGTESWGQTSTPAGESGILPPGMDGRISQRRRTFQQWLPGGTSVPPGGTPRLTGRWDAHLHGSAEPCRMAWSALAIAACLLGMATKEVMVSAPLLVLLYDRTFVAGTFQAALRQRWRLYAGLGIGWVLLAFESGSQMADSNATVSRWLYALTQSWAITHYLWLSVWPHPLVFDYGTILVTRAAQVVPSALIVAALAGGTVVCLRRRPALGFAGCWFFAILAPTSSVLPLAGQTVAEHRMYLPLAAVMTLAVLGVYRLAGRRSGVLFLTVAVVFTFLTARRNADYRSELALWRETAAARPDNARAQNNLGLVLLAKGQVDGAIACFQKALVIQPDYAEPHYSLGCLARDRGRLDEAKAQFQKAVEIKPDDANAHANLGWLLLQSGQVEKAIEHLQKAATIQPANAGFQNNIGFALLQAGKVDEAMAFFQKALALQPDLTAARQNLGLALQRKGRTHETGTNTTRNNGLATERELHQADQPIRDTGGTNNPAQTLRP